MDIIGKTILLFKEKGLSGERLSTMIERLSVAVTEQMLIVHVRWIASLRSSA
jgi:hypothetical protein